MLIADLWGEKWRVQISAESQLTLFEVKRAGKNKKKILEALTNGLIRNEKMRQEFEQDHLRVKELIKKPWWLF